MVHVRPVGVSVLICTYNGAQRLATTLEHLAKQQVASEIPWEIILVDNNSSDNSIEFCAAYWKNCGAPVALRTFWQPIPGKNYALELAYSEAEYEFMCIVDDDNWLNNDYLQVGFDYLNKHKNIGLIGGRSTGAFEVTMPAWFPKVSRNYAVGTPVLFTGNPPRLLTEAGPISQGALCGAGLFMRYTAWNLLKQANFQSLLNGRVGEKQLMGGEDDELSYAVKLAGYEIWYTPALCLTHFMTKNRLTKEYVPRIIHSFSETFTRLSVYRRLTYNSAVDYSQTYPWIKDFIYLTIRTFSMRNLLKYLKLRFQDDIEYLLMQEQFYIWINFIKDFNKTRVNYIEVKNMQQRARLLYKKAISSY
ncbi:glycosyltransferase family 2 protein [Hymenobacter sp. NBH84]|uniref:glycosyltransferase n=1 Tax=Hymenobacter sp. NBH84 TaxID=2596915 RepID=UPI0016292210|nr:glycosyltransferase [Hymenobacter sp. NBH84]QNE38420.1 glycosyltransferase family 2 protein [Hymenobacter sp. NBH84]